MNPKERNIPNGEKELLKRISAGDEAAMCIIYERYRKKVYSYALKIIKSVEPAEDILHEVFLKIWQHPNAGEIGCLDSYLRIATRNYTLKLLRRRQLEAKTNREMFYDWNEAHQDTEDTILLEDTRQLLQKAIERLPPKQKLVYRLCREEGLEYGEAARRMAISRLTVKTHMQLALRSLRTYFSTHTDVFMVVILLYILGEK